MCPTNKKLKLLYILDILRKYSDEDHPVNAAEIAEKLLEHGIEAERKSIYNDLKLLEDFGYDIIKTKTPRSGWFIGAREFEIPELFLLSDAVRSAKFISVKKTRELINKLNGMMSIYQEDKRNIGVYFGPTEKSGNEEIFYTIDTISRALKENKKIDIVYKRRAFDSNRQITEVLKDMKLSPYALCWYDDHYYVICNNDKYDNLMHLRVDRISSARVSEQKSRHFSEVSVYKDFFDTADYSSKVFGMFSGEIEDVEFYCDRSITEQVIDRFGEGIFTTHVTDDGFHFRAKVAISDALVTWIMNYGSKLKVIRPEKLKDMICDRANEIIKIYSDGEKK